MATSFLSRHGQNILTVATVALMVFIVCFCGYVILNAKVERDPAYRAPARVQYSTSWQSVEVYADEVNVVLSKLPDTCDVTINEGAYQSTKIVLYQCKESGIGE